MRRRRAALRAGAVVTLVAVGLGACAAEGVRRDDRFGDDGSTATTSGVGGGGGVMISSGIGGAVDTTTAAITTSAGVTTSGGNGCSYEAPNSCTSASNIEEMAGDDGGDIRVIKGTTNRFVKVFVAETVGSIISFPSLKLSARLDDSPGMDFDMVVYNGGATPSCGGESYLIENDPEYIQTTWGDNKNNDDGTWWIFEIVHKSGTQCGAAAEWTLTLAGNFVIDCTSDGACTTDDDCVCGDCANDPYCSDPNNCVADGVCNPYLEGCVCSDCAPTPACP